MKNTKMRRIATVLAAGSLAVAALAPAAMAADATNVTVSGDTFSVTSPAVSDFAAVTLNGTQRTTTATVGTYDVTDPRGTGDGWNVTVQATQFAEWDSTLNTGAGGYVTGGRTLGLNSLSLPQPTVAKIDSTSSAVPSITAGPYTVDAAAAVKIASAATGDGMGSYRFTQGDATLTIPASAYAKDYRSTLTVSLVTGP